MNNNNSDTDRKIDELNTNHDAKQKKETNAEKQKQNYEDYKKELRKIVYEKQK